MKHLKTYERASLHHHFFPVEEENLKEIYEYFYKLGCNPTIYKIPEKWKRSLTNMNKDYIVYYNDRNKKVNNFILNRSYSVTTFDMREFEIDDEKEKEMELFVNQLKYNL